MKYRFKNRQTWHRNDNSNTHFAKAKRKYGYDDFELIILEDNIPKDKMSEREIYWIEYYDSFNNGYNSTTGGEGGNTYSKKSEEELNKIKAKISKSNSGSNNGMAKHPELVRGENNPMYGKKPHNAQTLKLKNIITGEIKIFDRAYKVAEFFGKKSGSFVTKMKQNKMVVDNWVIIEEDVEATESIV